MPVAIRKALDRAPGDLAKAGVVAQEGLDHQLRTAHAIQRGFEGVGDLPVAPAMAAGRDAPMTVEPMAGSG